MKNTLPHVLFLVLVPVLSSAKEGYSIAFVSKPEYLIAGSRTPVAVHYAVPPEATATLRLEVKAPGYHVIETQTIGGTGDTSIDAVAPSFATARECHLILWIGEDWRNPLAGLVHTGQISVVSPQRAARYEAERREAEQLLADQSTGGRSIGLFVGNAPWGEALSEELQRGIDGCKVRNIPPGWLDNPFALRPEVFDLIVLCNPEAVPAGAKQSLPHYVSEGGRLIVLGAMPFQRALWRHGDEWLEFSTFREKLLPLLKPDIVLPFTDRSRVWTRSSNDLEPPSTAGVEDGVLHIHVANLTGWDTFQSPLDGLPGGTDACFYFRARGDVTTSQVAVELREKDGSRWIATVAVGTTFEPTLVPLSQFRYWHDSDSRQRGGQGDCVHLADVGSISFGFAHTHTLEVPNGAHDVWIDDVGTVTPGPDVDLAALAPGDTAEPVLETVSPHYKTYPVTNFACTRMNPVQAIVPPLAVQPASLRSPVARPQGTGLNKGRTFRYIPLIDALGADGRGVGAAATLLLYNAEKHFGMVANVPVSEPSFFAQPSVHKWVGALAWRMLDGLFLYEGGAEYYASFGGEQMRLGCEVIELSSRADSQSGPPPNSNTWQVRTTVTDPDGEVLSWTPESMSYRREPESPSSVATSELWQIPAGADGPFRVTVELVRDGNVIDRLAHDVAIWRPNPKPAFILPRDGDFWLDGQQWYAHGVNYMPSSGIGIEDGEYFEYWLDPRSYDPDIIERDLTDCEAIGFNAVSVFQYHRSLSSRNLIDLLVRCRTHHLKVNLSLRPGTPMDFPWDLVREMIERGRLAENDDIFAYDLAWEPMWRGHDHRRSYDREWETWLVDAYGSIAQAEAAWGYPAPRDEGGALTNPSDAQMGKEGAWSRMVQDYHRFLNGVIQQRYGRARELVCSIDPNHSVSFRMNSAGDPTHGPSWPCYDFKGLAGAVDIMEPEGYGRIGDWARVKGGWWTVAYARCAAPGTPLIWAEFGYSACVRAIQQATPEKLAFAEKYYDDFYTMAYRSGANGTFCWWFPGGYRWNERSDFGILNPDRSWRGITHVIRKWSTPFTTPRELPKPDVWMEFDREKTSLGIPGLYQQTEGAFWQAVDAGKTPGLREVTH